jgi:nucleotide-binding universal stress UspA family protein
MTDAIMDEAKDGAEAAGVKRIKTATREGKTARAICDYAKVNKIELIVMGSRGRGEVEALLLGSVSTKVSMLAQCKVMLVK